MSSESQDMSQASSEEKLRPAAVRKKAAARLAALQYSYSREFDDSSQLLAVSAFLESYLPDILPQLQVNKMDDDHFNQLIAGVHEGREELDSQISSHLRDDWQLDRLPRHELCLLRQGCFELKQMPHVPARAVLSEYSAMADEFQADVGFVLGVLNALAATYRKVEMGR